MKMAMTLASAVASHPHTKGGPCRREVTGAANSRPETRHETGPIAQARQLAWAFADLSQNTACSVEGNEQSRLVADDLGEAALSFVPIEPGG